MTSFPQLHELSEALLEETGLKGRASVEEGADETSLPVLRLSKMLDEDPKKVTAISVPKVSQQFQVILDFLRSSSLYRIDRLLHKAPTSSARLKRHCAGEKRVRFADCSFPSDERSGKAPGQIAISKSWTVGTCAGISKGKNSRRSTGRCVKWPDDQSLGEFKLTMKVNRSNLAQHRNINMLDNTTEQDHAFVSIAAIHDRNRREIIIASDYGMDGITWFMRMIQFLDSRVKYRIEKVKRRHIEDSSTNVTK